MQQPGQRSLQRQFITAEGQRLVIPSGGSSRLGIGGQGQVFRAKLAGQPLAVKLRRGLDPAHLLALQALSASCGELATLPLHLIYGDHDSGRKRLLGFGMRCLDLQSSLTAARLFNFQEIQRLPRYSWADAVLLALRLAQTVAQLHRHGVVIGDLNPENVVFEPLADPSGGSDWRAVLLDTDSFQIQSGDGTRHFCPVSRPLYGAPELIGTELSRTWRQPCSDLFALAVVIYQLLLHDHPYDNAINQAEPDLPVTTKIGRGLYPHAAVPPAAVQASPYRPAPADISAAIDQAFRRSFTAWAGLRPTALEWVVLLQELKQQLVRCQRTPLHHHVRGLPCLWCATEQRVGQPICRFSRGSAAETSYNASRQATHPGTRQDRRQDLGPELEQLRALQGRQKQLVAQRALLAETLLQQEAQLLQWRLHHADGKQLLDPETWQSPMRSARQRLSQWLGHTAKVRRRQESEQQLLDWAERTANAIRAQLEVWEARRCSLLEQLAGQSLTAIASLPSPAASTAELQALVASVQARRKDDWLNDALANELLRNWRIAGVGQARVQLLEAHGLVNGAQLRQHLDRITAIEGIGPGLQQRLRLHLDQVIEEIGQRQSNQPAPDLPCLPLIEPADLEMLDGLEAAMVAWLQELGLLQQELQGFSLWLQQQFQQRDHLLQAYGALF